MCVLQKGLVKENVNQIEYLQKKFWNTLRCWFMKKSILNFIINLPEGVK